MRRCWSLSLAASLPVLAGLACGDPLESGQLIDRTRPLAARVHVEGAPDRAWPAPGESAWVEWLVVGPEPAPRLTWSLWVCVSGAVRSAQSACGGPVITVSEQTDPTTEPPRIAFEVPGQANLGDAGGLTVFGVLCEGGVATFDPARVDAQCSSGTTRMLRVFSDVSVQLGTGTNQHPNLADDRIELDGELWPTVTDCSAADATRVSAGSPTRLLSVVFEGDDRQPLEAADTPLGDPRETLQLSHLSTLGNLERPFSFVEARDTANPPRIDVGWTPPVEASPAGDVARFAFVVRDGRGGVDWQLRQLCLVP